MTTSPAPPPPPPAPPWRATATLWVLLAAFAFLLGSMIVGAVRRPEVARWAVTPPNPVPVGDTLVGPTVVTVDATDERRWTFFDFSRNAAVTAPGPTEWDLAIRRFHVIANGGPGFAGRGGIADLGRVPFASVTTLPDTGYVPTAADSTHPAIRRWYRYGFSSHLLRPKGHVYAVRTADGRYAKLEIVSYYCGEARAGCLTFRYSYQGDGSRRVVAVTATDRSAPAPGAATTH
jgi:hypothetical protein